MSWLFSPVLYKDEPHENCNVVHQEKEKLAENLCENRVSMCTKAYIFKKWEMNIYEMTNDTPRIQVRHELYWWCIIEAISIKFMRQLVKKTFGVREERKIGFCHSPMVIVLKIVPTTANNKIVPRLSKNSLLGMKYPASKMIGGSM